MSDFDNQIKNARGRVYLPELLKHVSKLEKREDKVLALRAYANKNSEHLAAVRAFMELMWHPRTTFDLPEGAPPYTTTYPDYTLAPSSLQKEMKRSKYFMPAHPSFAQNPIKRERLFIQSLESMYKDDARLFLMIKDRKLDARVYKNVDEDLFREAFSQWLPPKENPTEEPKKD